jgi:CIC family chloride channel protein
MAITGGGVLEGITWTSVELLLFLCVAKLVAASLTIGSGGSAGDFAPSIALGGLLGGAFGLAAQILLDDPRIVGMGTFYGGIAHVPLAALVLVSEMAGSYDLLVPMMLAMGIALLALRNHTLYPAQIRSAKLSPVHRARFDGDVLAAVHVGDVIDRSRTVHGFELETPTATLLDIVGQAPEQDVFPVLDTAGALRGMITGDQVRLIASHREVEAWTIAADIMQAPVVVRDSADLRRAAEVLIVSGLRELLVTDVSGAIVGLLDEHDVSRTFLDRTGRTDDAETSGPTGNTIGGEP